jgi:hypothetical protein
MPASFADLWKNHPSNNAENAPCKDKQGASAFPNQCAIRLGVAITASGVSLSSFHGAFCWHGHGRVHPLRVEQVIKWLNGGRARFVGKGVSTKRPKKGKIDANAFANQRGIIACRNFYGAGNQGDHIDLWNGFAMAHGSVQYITESEEVWFWAIA